MKKARIRRRLKDRDRNEKWSTYPLKEKAKTVLFHEDIKVVMIENVNKGRKFLPLCRKGDTVCIDRLLCKNNL